MDIVLLIIVTILIQFGSHFVPWGPIFGKREIGKLPAYVIGTLTNSLIFSAFFLLAGQLYPIAILWAVVIASGAGVFAAYGLEWAIKTRSRASDAEQREESLMEMRDEPDQRT